MIPQPSTYQCSRCQEVFASATTLRRHMKRKISCTGLKSTRSRDPNDPNAAQKSIRELKTAAKQLNEPIPMNQLEEIQQLVTYYQSQFERLFSKQPEIQKSLRTYSMAIYVVTQVRKRNVVPQLDDIQQSIKQYTKEMNAIDAERLAVNDLTTQINEFIDHPEKDTERRPRTKKEEDLFMKRFWSFIESRTRLSILEITVTMQQPQQPQMATQTPPPLIDLGKLAEAADKGAIKELRRKEIEGTGIALGLTGGLAALHWFERLKDPLLTMAAWFTGLTAKSFPTHFTIPYINWALPVPDFISSFLTGAWGWVIWVADTVFSSIAVFLANQGWATATVAFILIYALTTLVYRLLNSDVTFKPIGGLAGLNVKLHQI